jgi:hypothetical protein
MNVPKDAMRAYQAHKTGAAFRAITFSLTLDEWWALWEPHWAARDLLDLQMCRTADLGGYATGNVRTSRALQLLPGRTLPDRLNRHEARAIRRALAANEGNASAAARALGITFRQMRYALKKHARLATLQDAASLSDVNGM